MPREAGNVEIHFENGKFSIKVDGDEFPYWVAKTEEGIKVESLEGYSIVHLPVLVFGNIKITQRG